MKINILEPKGTNWTGNAKKVILPVEDGDVCVLDFHQPFLMRLRKGQIKMPAGTKSVKDGIAFMRSNELTVFVES